MSGIINSVTSRFLTNREYKTALRYMSLDTGSGVKGVIHQLATSRRLHLCAREPGASYFWLENKLALAKPARL